MIGRDVAVAAQEQGRVRKIRVEGRREPAIVLGRVRHLRRDDRSQVAPRPNLAEQRVVVEVVRRQVWPWSNDSLTITSESVTALYGSVGAGNWLFRISEKTTARCAGFFGSAVMLPAAQLRKALS